jgi:hypothetical protein
MANLSLQLLLPHPPPPACPPRLLCLDAGVRVLPNSPCAAHANSRPYERGPCSDAHLTLSSQRGELVGSWDRDHRRWYICTDFMHLVCVHRELIEYIFFTRPYCELCAVEGETETCTTSIKK